MPDLADVQVEQPAAGTAVAVFLGEYDMADEDKMSGLLTSLVTENELVVADFSQAGFIDSTILHVLVQTRTEAEKRGRTFRLQLGTADIVRAAIRASGFDKVFDIKPTREAALELGI